MIDILENDVKQRLYYNCLYSNQLTDWKPSCWPDRAYDSIGSIDPCDCDEFFCAVGYDKFDNFGEPSKIRCRKW